MELAGIVFLIGWPVVGIITAIYYLTTIWGGDIYIEDIFKVILIALIGYTSGICALFSIYEDRIINFTQKVIIKGKD